ncbi:cysteine hydrolase family protein [Pseudomonas gingeri]
MKNPSAQSTSPYADPTEPALPDPGMRLDLRRAALVVIDPQIDFLSPEGVSWPVFGKSIVEHDTVKHIGGPLEKVMHSIGMFDRKGPLTLDGFENSGADFMPEYKPYILDGKTLIASPHKVYGPETNDLALQLRKHGVSQIILAGMAANLCVESHLRELLELGFEVAVVRDATAGPTTPEGDGYLAALINYRYIANALWSTEQTLGYLRGSRLD